MSLWRFPRGYYITGESDRMPCVDRNGAGVRRVIHPNSAALAIGGWELMRSGWGSVQDRAIRVRFYTQRIGEAVECQAIMRFLCWHCQ